jgi:D-glycero-beta-D-manno-heptose 1-phosphate adenylyltransferase
MRSYQSKILTRRALMEERHRLKAAGISFVFTNGCFDILHAGHVDYLCFARQQGDVLAVGMNSDASVRTLKGEGRPVVPEQDRAQILAALECVDYVVVFDEVQVDSLIADLLPDILVKGEDRKDWVCGREVVEAHGGRVVLAPLVKGRSTTNVIGKILSTSAPDKSFKPDKV